MLLFFFFNVLHEKLHLVHGFVLHQLYLIYVWFILIMNSSVVWFIREH